MQHPRDCFHCKRYGTVYQCAKGHRLTQLYSHTSVVTVKGNRGLVNCRDCNDFDYFPANIDKWPDEESFGDWHTFSKDAKFYYLSEIKRREN